MKLQNYAKFTYVLLAFPTDSLEDINDTIKNSRATTLYDTIKKSFLKATETFKNLEPD